MAYSWAQIYNAIEDWELDCIRGKGHLSGPHILRNIANNSVYANLLNASADRIEELENQLKQEQDRSSNLMWERDARNGGLMDGR